MPVYEFRCPECNNVFEVLWRREDISDSCECPTCGELASRKFSLFGFQFSQFLKELRSSAYIKGTNIKLEDVPRKGLIPAAKRGDKEAQQLLGRR